MNIKWLTTEQRIHKSKNYRHITYTNKYTYCMRINIWTLINMSYLQVNNKYVIGELININGHKNTYIHINAFIIFT